MALPLENCVIERCMPRGYTWAKFVRCWTGDPKGARFFEEQENPATGECMPAAYFTTLIVYDRTEGLHERAVKFQGSDALWAQLELSERQQIALVSCEGHLVTRSYDGYDGKPIVQTTVHIKQGTVMMHGIQHQTADATPVMPPEPYESEPTGLVAWPEPGPSEDALDNMDDAPF